MGVEVNILELGSHTGVEVWVEVREGEAEGEVLHLPAHLLGAEVEGVARGQVQDLGV